MGFVKLKDEGGIAVGWTGGLVGFGLWGEEGGEEGGGKGFIEGRGKGDETHISHLRGSSCGRRRDTG